MATFCPLFEGKNGHENRQKYNIYVIKLNFKRVGEKKWPFGHKTGKEYLWTNI